MAKKPPDDLDQFINWLRDIPTGKLKRMLADAYWKRQIDKTEIRRAFLLSKKGVDITTEDPPDGRPKTKTRRETPRRRTRKS